MADIEKCHFYQNFNDLEIWYACVPNLSQKQIFLEQEKDEK